MKQIEFNTAPCLHCFMSVILNSLPTEVMLCDSEHSFEDILRHSHLITVTRLFDRYVTIAPDIWCSINASIIFEDILRHSHLITVTRLFDRYVTIAPIYGAL